MTEGKCERYVLLAILFSFIFLILFLSHGPPPHSPPSEENLRHRLISFAFLIEVETGQLLVVEQPNDWMASSIYDLQKEATAISGTPEGFTCLVKADTPEALSDRVVASRSRYNCLVEIDKHSVASHTISAVEKKE